MTEGDTRWVELMGELRGIRQDVNRIETRIEKDADDLFQRVKVLEVSTALNTQALETTRTQLKRDMAFIAAAIGSGGGIAASLLSKLF